MQDIRTLAVRISSGLGLQRLLAGASDRSLTTILFHRFIFAEEPLDTARDRLKRQCDWLRKSYSPVALDEATEGLRTGRLPRRPLLVTIDDALIDILKVNDIFASFELPVAIFACVGWCADASGAHADTLLASIVSAFEWYEGEERKIDAGRCQLTLGRAHREIAIDQILANRQDLLPDYERILAQLRTITGKIGRRSVCTWDELVDLQSAGVSIGCHSVSHINLASANSRRLSFEVNEARRILRAKLGECAAFAYPFGTSEAFSASTTEAVRQAGFRCAFLTHSDFADERTDLYQLPRIAMPDRSMPDGEFRARASGGGIALGWAKKFLRKGAVSG